MLTAHVSWCQQQDDQINRMAIDRRKIDWAAQLGKQCETAWERLKSRVRKGEAFPEPCGTECFSCLKRNEKYTRFE